MSAPYDAPSCTQPVGWHNIPRTVMVECSSGHTVVYEDGKRFAPPIIMHENWVKIGCTTIERAVVEAIHEQFQKNFSKKDREVKIQ